MDDSEGKMMAIIWEIARDGHCVQDETLQYLFLLLFKVALNTLVLSFWVRSIHKSFLGICSLSIYLVDLLLVCAIAATWFYRQSISTSEYTCLILSHASSVYAMIPLPVLLLGALDSITYPQPSARRSAPCRTIAHCVVVPLMWALACFYSYRYTVAEVVDIEYKEGGRARVCAVQDSSVISYFSEVLAIAVSCTLLLYCRQLPRWLRQASRLSAHRDAPRGGLQRDPAFSFTKLEERRGEGERAVASGQPDQQRSPPLFVSLTLCFAMTWSPYLVISILLGFDVPAYFTVNFLWLACSNSLLVGLAYWLRSEQLGPCSEFPDEVTEWNVYWHLSKGAGRTMQEKLSQGLFTVSGADTEPLLKV